MVTSSSAFVKAVGCQLSPADKICGLVSKSRNNIKNRIYVLILLTLACLMSQMQRYVLIATNVSMAQELKFGDSILVKPPAKINSSLSPPEGTHATYNICSSLSTLSSSSSSSSSSVECVEVSSNSSDVVERRYLGTGMQYQVLAGPVFIMVFAISAIPLGLIAGMRHINRSFMLSVLVILWSTMTVLCGLSGHFWQVAISRMALGVFEAGCNPFSASIISDYFPQSQRGFAMALYTLGVYMGFSSSFLLIMANRVIGWRYTYFVAGFLGVVLGLLIMLTVREPQRPPAPVVKSKSRRKKHDVCNRRMVALCDPVVVLFCVAAAIRCGGGSVWAYNLNNFYNHYYDNPQVERYMSWIPMVFGALGSMAGGAISDVLTRKGGFTARFLVLIGSQILAGPLQICSLYLDVPWALLMQIPTCFMAEMWMGVAMVIMMDIVPTNLKALSISIFFLTLNVIGGNMNVLVPPLTKVFNFRFALFLTIPVCYWIGAFLFAVTMVILRFNIKKQSNKDEYQPVIYKCMNMNVSEPNTDTKETENLQDNANSELV